ncbi:MAG TPA: hypothetical protein VEG28_04480, partial [Dehalococcoidia bacterium]|nr:hypothetical protein [Dehalococcoidia bacterium]
MIPPTSYSYGSPIRSYDYVRDANNELEKLAIGGLAALVLGASLRSPNLFKAGAALCVAGVAG